MLGEAPRVQHTPWDSTLLFLEAVRGLSFAANARTANLCGSGAGTRAADIGRVARFAVKRVYYPPKSLCRCPMVFSLRLGGEGRGPAYGGWTPKWGVTLITAPTSKIGQAVEISGALV